jgi:meromycolic acid enoyl-[acyl-carrier-protein] reductase
MLLAGKRLLITGVLTQASVAYSVAEQAQHAGAEIVLTSFGRAKRITERAAAALPHPPDVLELDVNAADDYDHVARELRERWGSVDGVLHAVAWAPPDAIDGYFLSTSDESVIAAFKTSALSLKTLAEKLYPLLEEAPAGGSIVALDFESSRAWPVYDWMGVSKAALGAIARYLACYLGPRGIRVNLLSSGPLDTVAAQNIPGFQGICKEWRRAPLGWDTEDVSPTARAACFLLSDWSTGMTGSTLRVDGGFVAAGVPFDEIADWVEGWRPGGVAPAPAEAASDG